MDRLPALRFRQVRQGANKADWQPSDDKLDGVNNRVGGRFERQRVRAARVTRCLHVVLVHRTRIAR